MNLSQLLVSDDLQHGSAGGLHMTASPMVQVCTYVCDVPQVKQ